MSPKKSAPVHWFPNWSFGRSFLLLFGIMIIGCANIPRVKYSQTQVTGNGRIFNSENLGNTHYNRLLDEMRGSQFGDAIFQRNTSVYWIIPGIDRLDLEITSGEENFSEIEHQSRLNSFIALHDRFLIFLIDLRMPFFGGWTQTQLFEYLQKNLVVSLESGQGMIYAPERRIFQVVERIHQRRSLNASSKNELEVGVLIRVLFNRETDSATIISKSTQSIALKLRLREKPPFKIGFFDEKFYQGFEWKVVTRIKSHNVK